jgi:hypothetical protein
MTRAQLEHIIRTAGAIAGVADLVVIGSQAVLGQFPDAPEEFLVPNEADVYPSFHPGRIDLIDAHYRCMVRREILEKRLAVTESQAKIRALVEKDASGFRRR